MARCKCCNTEDSIGTIIVIEKSKRLPFSGIFNICNKCMEKPMKSMEILQNQIKQIKDWDERKEQYQNTRNWCRKCLQPIEQEKWTVIFLDSNHYIKNTSYIDEQCGQRLLKDLKIWVPSAKESEYKKLTSLEFQNVNI
jgi:hypothetical protein